MGFSWDFLKTLEHNNYSTTNIIIQQQLTMSTTNITKKRATTSTSQVETPNKRLKQEEEAEGCPEKQQDSKKPMSVKKTKDQDQEQDQKEEQVHKVQEFPQYVQEFPQFVRAVMQKLLQLEADFKDGKCSSVSLVQQILDINVDWTLTCDKILKDNAVKTLNEWVRKYDNMEEFHKTLEYISDLRDRYELNRKYDNMEEFHKTLEYISDLRDRYN